MAMQQGATRWRASQLRELLGVSVQTLARWRTWWTEVFAASAFWKAARAAFSPPVEETTAPHALLQRFAGDVLERLGALLRFLVRCRRQRRMCPIGVGDGISDEQ